ncbi:MAG: M23 family metallopeptidase [Alphaproteobacteria bacterium]|nr:M23 family metallopeptidase [Alphaproteobacteria bacterium]
MEKLGRNGGYGNYVRIRHNGRIKTAYAHMHKFAKGLKGGSRVEQGDVIGYVGTTGRSTGPHLHYEVLVNDKQVNPNSIDLPTGEQLAGKELKRFKALVEKARQQYVSLSKSFKFAAFNDGSEPPKPTKKSG